MMDMQSTSPTLCAWCLDVAGLLATQDESHGICAQHADQLRARLAARRRTIVEKTVNFVLVPSDPEPERLWFPFVQHTNRPEYPSNWSKASWTLRRVYGFRCEVCGSSCGVSVHHKGVPYPDGTPGNPRDKHDLRRSNLAVLCKYHHDQADEEQRQRRKR